MRTSSRMVKGREGRKARYNNLHEISNTNAHFIDTLHTFLLHNCTRNVFCKQFWVGWVGDFYKGISNRRSIVRWLKCVGTTWRIVGCVHWMHKVRQRGNELPSASETVISESSESVCCLYLFGGGMRPISNDWVLGTHGYNRLSHT
jgi:hypothetical protein